MKIKIIWSSEFSYFSNKPTSNTTSTSNYIIIDLF